MCESYVAAGLPPDRFWSITPRLYATEVNGALARIKRERALVWEGAFLPYAKKPPTLKEFIGGSVIREPSSFLDMRLRSSTKGLRGITMAEHRASMH